MENLKESIVCKVVSFVVIQLCVITMFFSGIVIAFNAGYGWYTSDSESVRKDILNEVGYDLQIEMHDRLSYNIQFYESDYAVWHEYFLKDNPLPEGIGYKLEILDTINHDLNDIKLKKNYSLSEAYGVCETELSNDLFRFTVYVADPLVTGKSVNEIYPEKQAAQYQFYSMIYQYNKLAIAAFVLGLTVFIILFAYLVSCMKRRVYTDGVLKKLPVDLISCICIGVAVTPLICLSNASANSYNYDVLVVFAVATILVVSAAITTLLLFLIYRVKCGKWWQNTVAVVLLKLSKKAVWVFIKYIKKTAVWIREKIKSVFGILAICVRKIPLIWKTITALIVLWFVNLVIAINFCYSDVVTVLWILSAVLVSVAVMYIALCMKRLQKSAQQLAEGNLSYETETKGLFWDFAEHAENLNRISDGMATAVDERIKSERFKAELITNVSHDIKTPLTSIINYVDLLNKENIEDEKVREYIEVLDRQSRRLKKLTEDLMDASKVSTGNIKIDMSPCNVGMLMSQTMGEYLSKAEARELDLILKLPERELQILADGRRLWRVFDNLLNNICKYGQPGTRVYLSLGEVDGKAIIIYRNVSKYELDVNAEELMERFVRGDRSRHTEGSGLGLSIAKNLVELQGGSFKIDIDGDLFKVTITFDLLNL